MKLQKVGNEAGTLRCFGKLGQISTCTSLIVLAMVGDCGLFFMAYSAPEFLFHDFRFVPHHLLFGCMLKYYGVHFPKFSP